MSIRLFEEFQRKNVAVKVGSLNSEGRAEEIVIAIPLKSQQGKAQELNEEFIKVIEYEYAVKYLEMMGIEPNPKMITNLLRNQPLSSCELSSGWNNSGSIADVLYIYPNKRKKKTFENSVDKFASVIEGTTANRKESVKFQPLLFEQSETMQLEEQRTVEEVKNIN